MLILIDVDASDMMTIFLYFEIPRLQKNKSIQEKNNFMLEIITVKIEETSG